jgi:hypothetical protein
LSHNVTHFLDSKAFPVTEISLSSRFWGAVERLLAGGLHAEDEIITLAEMDTPVSVTAVHDCTESLLNALLSGLKKYGTSLIDGHYFFRTLSLLAHRLPHR